MSRKSSFWRDGLVPLNNENHPFGEEDHLHVTYSIYQLPHEFREGEANNSPSSKLAALWNEGLLPLDSPKSSSGDLSPQTVNPLSRKKSTLADSNGGRSGNSSSRSVQG